MKKIAISDAASIPPMTAVPSTCRETAPDPCAIHSGTQPRMNANAVIRIGRKPDARAGQRRFFDAFFRFRIRALANSTIRMAFFAARPISITSPICA